MMQNGRLDKKGGNVNTSNGYKYSKVIPNQLLSRSLAWSIQKIIARVVVFL